MSAPDVADGRPPLTPLDRLVAIEEIRCLKARYFRALDTKNWSELATVFAADAVFDIRAVNSARHPLTREWTPPLGGPEQVFRGREVIVAMIRDAIQGLYTIHHAHVPEIDVHDAGSASGIWPMEDVLRQAGGELLLNGSGYYYETYERGSSGWHIKSSRLERLFVAGGALEVPAAR